MLAQCYNNHMIEKKSQTIEEFKAKVLKLLEDELLIEGSRPEINSIVLGRNAFRQELRTEISKLN